MNDELYNPTFWHWLMLACVFYGLEILAPGVFFLWLGFAATASGLLKLALPELGWMPQYVLFSIFSVLSLVLWKKFAKRGLAEETDQPQLNQRNQRYLGRTLVLSEPIVNGIGKVTVEDSQWKVSGADAEAGSKVTVVQIDGSLFHVEPAQ